MHLDSVYESNKRKHVFDRIITFDWESKGHVIVTDERRGYQDTSIPAYKNTFKRGMYKLVDNYDY